MTARKEAVTNCSAGSWRNVMSDDKSKVKEDRKLVASTENYEVADFAAKYGIPASEAKTIIKRYGPSRRKLDAHMSARRA